MTIVIDGTTGISSIGTLTGVTSISSASADTPVILGDSGTNYNTCRAWVNINGTAATPSIRADFNVTSITDNAAGDYTVNFTNNMPDANYSVAGSAKGTSTGNYAVFQIASTDTSSLSSVRVNTMTSSGGSPTRTDLDIVNVSVFR